MEELKNLDIRTITAEAATRISYQKRPTVTQVVATPDMVRRHLLSSVWAGCLDALARQEGNMTDGPMSTELALEELMRRGVSRESICVWDSSFRLRLENSEYRIYRRGTETVACPWPSDLWSVVRIGGDRFAEFLLYFDAHVPEILAEVPAILKTIRQREMEEKKALMEQEIMKTTVKALLEQYLKPLGLSAGFQLDEDGKVTLDLRRLQSGHLEIPLVELSEILNDQDSLLASLVEEPARVFESDRDF